MVMQSSWLLRTVLRDPRGSTLYPTRQEVVACGACGCGEDSAFFSDVGILSQAMQIPVSSQWWHSMVVDNVVLWGRTDQRCFFCKMQNSLHLCL